MALTTSGSAFPASQSQMSILSMFMRDNALDYGISEPAMGREPFLEKLGEIGVRPHLRTGNGCPYSFKNGNPIGDALAIYLGMDKLRHDVEGPDLVWGNVLDGLAWRGKPPISNPNDRIRLGPDLNGRLIRDGKIRVGEVVQTFDFSEMFYVRCACPG